MGLYSSLYLSLFHLHYTRLFPIYSTILNTEKNHPFINVLKYNLISFIAKHKVLCKPFNRTRCSTSFSTQT